MKGDYYRYLAEFQSGDAKQTSSDSSLDAYKAASGTYMLVLYIHTMCTVTWFVIVCMCSFSYCQTA